MKIKLIKNLYFNLTSWDIYDIIVAYISMEGVKNE